jgi:hypothetical protein
MSNIYKTAGDVPNEVLAKRLIELGHLVGEQNFRDFTMSVPAELDRDADLVLSMAGHRLLTQQKRIAELEAQSQWVSVEDRLPDELVPVELQGQPYGNKGVMHTYAFLYNGQWFFVDISFGWSDLSKTGEQLFSNEEMDEDDSSSITHWRPTPPAKEQKS